MSSWRCWTFTCGCGQQFRLCGRKVWAWVLCLNLWYFCRVKYMSTGLCTDVWPYKRNTGAVQFVDNTQSCTDPMLDFAERVVSFYVHRFSLSLENGLIFSATTKAGFFFSNCAVLRRIPTALWNFWYPIHTARGTFHVCTYCASTKATQNRTGPVPDLSLLGYICTDMLSFAPTHTAAELYSVLLCTTMQARLASLTGTGKVTMPVKKVRPFPYQASLLQSAVLGTYARASYHPSWS